MKKLLLVRHAKSSWSNPSQDDIDRPLNDRGKRDAPYMAAYCRTQGHLIDAIVSSPANRAYTTAEQFYKEFKKENKRFDKETDLYFGSERDILHIINTLDEDIECPAIFTHNPTITYFANLFAKELLDNVPTCGVVQLISSVDTWSALHYDNTYLKQYYFPKLVRAL